MHRRIIIISFIILGIGITAGLWAKFYATRPLPTKNFVADLIGESPIRVLKPQEVSIILTGDIMLSRNVADKIKKSQNPDLPFEKISKFLNSSDFNFGNLESPIAPPVCPPLSRGGCPEGGRGSEGIVGGHSLIFGAPSDYIKGLARANFKILSLANNHALDQGLSGISFTKKLLSESGLNTVGAGENQKAAWQSQIIEVRGVKIGFLAASYASFNDGGKSRNDYVARIEDLETLKSKILNLKSKTDIVIVSMHAGKEYTLEPNQAQKNFARAAVDYGANVVVGHHPHWVQPVERYCPKSNQPPPVKGGESSSDNSLPREGEVREGATRCGLIFYSLGNFVFDQEWSQKTKQGLAVKITLKGGELVSAELDPVTIENYCCARLSDEKEKSDILNNINATSSLITLP